MDTLLTSWTDDLPCKHSGIGRANNEIYRRDGQRAEMHPMQDRYFHFRQDDYDVSLYGLFAGFNGCSASDFACKRIPLELLLGQIDKNSGEEAVREALRNAFVNVDRDYFESIMDSITRLILLRDENDPRAKQLEAVTDAGASAVVAAIVNDRIFVAGCGDTRAVVCFKLPDGELKVHRLTVDHILSNADEVHRLRLLGLSSVANAALVPIGGYTRCLGFHRGKGGYKEDPLLKAASDDPVIPVPEIHGGIPIEPSFQFLVLFSKSLTDTISNVCPTSDPTLELCRMALEQFGENTLVSGVAQAVVDKIVRMHREQFEMTSSGVATTHEDMVLLVRNFNAKLSTGGRRKKSEDTTFTMTNTTESSSDVYVKSGKELPLNENGRIKAYVDFTHFEREFNKANVTQKA